MDSVRFQKELIKAKVPNHSMKLTRLSKEKKILIKYIINFFPELIRLFLFFRSRKFNLIQVNGSQQFKGAIAAKMAGIPLIWLIEDALMSRIVKVICKVLANITASGIIVVGKKVYEYYIEGTFLEKKPIIEIHPPVNTAIFRNENAVLNEQLSNFKGKKIITVSGINPTKGLEYFLKMASEIVAKYEDICFFIAAPNLKSQKNYFKKLENIISSSHLNDQNCKFLGMISDVPSFLKSGDIFVYTSISETGPMAVWEAMSMGKPIVTTDVGSVSEYLKDGVNAFIVEPRKTKDLVKKLETLLNDNELQKSMGSSVRSIAKEKLDVSIIAKKYVNFYEQIILKNQ